MLERLDFDMLVAEGHQYRSELLDLFAGVEEWVIDRSLKIGIKSSNASLGQRVKSLTTHKEYFKYPKRIDDLATRINAALALRNEVVHSRLTTLRDSQGCPRWIFSNIGGGNIMHPLCLGRADFKQKQTELKNLIKMLNDQALKPKTTATAPSASAATSGRAS